LSDVENTSCIVQFVYMLTMATKRYLSIDIIIIQPESSWLNVTSLNLGWCWKIPLPNDASANHRLRYNFTRLT